MYMQYVNRIVRCSAKHLSLASSWAKAAMCATHFLPARKEGKELHFYDSYSCSSIRTLILGPLELTEKWNELQHSPLLPRGKSCPRFLGSYGLFLRKGIQSWQVLLCKVPGSSGRRERLLSWWTCREELSIQHGISLWKSFQQLPQVWSQEPYLSYWGSLVSQQNDEFPSLLYYSFIPHGAFNFLIDCPILLLKCCVAYCWLLSLESVLKDWLLYCFRLSQWELQQMAKQYTL